MNAAVQQDFTEALELVDGDKAAAANLVLASALRAGPLATTSQGQPMTVPEVARFLRVRPDKVLAWIRSGRLCGYNIAERENGRPKYRINPDDLAAFTKRRVPLQQAPVGRPTGSRSVPKKVLSWSQPKTAKRGRM